MEYPTMHYLFTAHAAVAPLLNNNLNVRSKVNKPRQVLTYLQAHYNIQRLPCWIAVV